MTLSELLQLFETSQRRCHVVGDCQGAVVAALDLEGRLFTVVNDRVVNRINPEAFLGTCTRDTYLNPGGDGLWPAPEGSRLGYEYAIGDWRVPPGLTSARFWLLSTTPETASIRAEIDLLNSEGRGVPTAFERHVAISGENGTLKVDVTEVIEYLGAEPVARAACLLAPWSLCQFDSGPGCTVRFPLREASQCWDLYASSADRRSVKDGICTARTDAEGERYQVGLGPEVSWLEFHDPRSGLRVRREAASLEPGLSYIDIADRAPDQEPDGAPVRLSVYSDPDGFMEIEAAGGCPSALAPGTRLELKTTTTYSL